MIESITESRELENILAIVREYGLSVPGHSAKRLMKYVALLREGNQQTQLVSRHDNARLVSKHISESIASACAFSIRDAARILDFGSGGGLPGVPLAILFPDKQFDLLESKQKKIAFLKHVQTQLTLENVAIVPCHSDEIGASHSRVYDIVIARAVARLGRLWKSCRHLLKKKGVLLAMKGGDLAPELAELQKTYPALQVDLKIYPGNLVPERNERRLVVVYES